MRYAMKIMLIETFRLFDKSDKYFLLIQSQLYHDMITEMNHSMWGMYLGAIWYTFGQWKRRGDAFCTYPI